MEAIGDNFVLYILGGFFAVLAWIGKEMLRKIEELRKELGGMDKNIAVLVEKLNHNETRVMVLEDRVSRISKTQDEIRDRMHEIRNDMSTFVRIDPKDFS